MRDEDSRVLATENDELLSALRETEQKYTAAVAEYERLLEQANRPGVLHPGLARHLQNAISHVLACSDYMTPRLRVNGAESVPDRRKPVHFASLSRRENEIVCLLAAGLRPKDIASRIHLSPKTVNTHKTNAMRKLGVYNFADLLRLMISRETGEERIESTRRDRSNREDIQHVTSI